MLIVFRMSRSQFEQLMHLGKGFLEELKGINKNLDQINESQKESTTTNREGFTQVAEAISKITIPEPPPDDTAVKGTIVARYKFTEDQAPVEFDIECGDLKTAKGTPVGAQDIDLSGTSSSGQLAVEVSNQTVSEDGSKVKAHVVLTGQPMPNTELAVVTYVATNRDTGNQVAADVDEFETGPGEAAIGTIDSPVPLTPVDEG